MKYRNYLPIILFFSLIFLTKYADRVADMDLAESWKTHPFLLGFTIALWIFYFAYALYMIKLNRIESRKESYKEEQKKYLKKNIEIGVFLYIAKYGTIATILSPSVIIIMKYIGNPSIDFPYHLFWIGILGYPLAYLAWIVEKKRFEKLK
ncbi:MAG: hypothetical protein Q8S31_03945 [Alphaproteobacteria bacterium]|nr:hypothetical protein [Alphaproteobacteria bacterium]